MRAGGDIQFAPVTIPKQVAPQPPGWLKWLGEKIDAIFGPAVRWLADRLAELLGPVGRWLGLTGPFLEKVLIGLAVVAAALLLWRIAVVLRARAAARRGAGAGPADWSPDRADALALLEEADQLAGEGQFGAAVHLLLLRSVGQIGAARPEWLVPASTARDIAALPGLPERARNAFAVMAGRVERSLFARRTLAMDDWQAARGAYADFALEKL